MHQHLLQLPHLILLIFHQPWLWCCGPLRDGYTLSTREEQIKPGATIDLNTSRYRGTTTDVLQGARISEITQHIEFISGKIKNMTAFSIISRHCNAAGTWNPSPSLRKTRTCLSYIYIKSMPLLLMTWRCKEPGHQQLWQCPSSPGICWFHHQRD